MIPKSLPCEGLVTEVKNKALFFGSERFFSTVLARERTGKSSSAMNANYLLKFYVLNDVTILCKVSEHVHIILVIPEL